MPDDRIIGRKEIIASFTQLYGITTWKGCKDFIRRYKMPLRHTPSGKPFFFRFELEYFDARAELLQYRIVRVTDQ
jgi:hypothetical protein